MRCKLLGGIDSLRAKFSKPMVAFDQRQLKLKVSDTVEEIIKCNNSQNLVESSDFRSNEAVQKRLVKEFDKIPSAKYQGCRRGECQDFIRRPDNTIPSDTAAQALAALHNNPVIAYNRKSQIWMSPDLYSRYFNEETHAQHIVFAYSLLRCIQEKKLSLVTQQNKGV